MNGPGFGFGWGFHALVLFGIVVLWVLVIAGVLWALYFVIRTAVTRGILRADALRAGGTIAGRHPQSHPSPAAQPVAPPATGPHPATEAERRPDPTPPDVAA